MHHTIEHNILALLRAGAFRYTEGATLVPMSKHKWRVLAKAAQQLRILPDIQKGAQMLNSPDAEIIQKEVLSLTPAEEIPVASAPSLFNHWSDKHLMEVREEEMNAPDTSEETLLLLDAIVENAYSIIRDDVNVCSMVSIGKKILASKDKVDKQKLSSWLSYIGLVQVANLQANMLADILMIQPDFIPFYVKPYPSAGKQFLAAMYSPFRSHSFSTITRLNVAMMETLSYKFTNAITKITDIEE